MSTIKNFKPLPPPDVLAEIVKDELTGHSRHAINRTAELLGWPYQTVYSQLDGRARINFEVLRAAWVVTQSQTILDLLLSPGFLAMPSPEAIRGSLKDPESEILDVYTSLTKAADRFRELMTDGAIDPLEAPEIDPLINQVDREWAEVKAAVNKAKNNQS